MAAMSEQLRRTLVDPEAAEVPLAQGRRGHAKKAIGLGALIGAMVGLAIFYGSPSGNTSPQQPAQLAAVGSIGEFNALLQTIPISDAEDMFKALPEYQLKALFADFLKIIGSTAPKTDGSWQRETGPRKQFDTEEEHAHRLNVFRTNLLDILRRNAEMQRINPEAHRAVFGITQFADWAPKEFKFMRSLSGTNITKMNEQVAKEKAATRGLFPEGISTASKKGDTRALQSCGLSYPVRDQGQCGDCWAFSTSEVNRMRVYKQYNKVVPVLSAQQLVDCWPDDIGDSCDDGVNGCCGGWPYKAINWLHDTGGQSTADAYGALISDKHPFTSENCKAGIPKAVLPGKALFPSSEEIMATWLCEFGAFSVAVDASPLNSYSSGVLVPSNCPNQVDHAVLVVGIDTTTYNIPVWLLQNSWGTSWGVQPNPPYEYGAGKSGFWLLAYGYDTCKVLDYATIPKSAAPV